MALTAVRSGNMVLSFVLELCLLAAFAYWGIKTGEGTLMKILLGIGAPLVTAIFWGIFMAPKASHRAGPLVYWIVKFILFGLAALALRAAGNQTLGWVLGAVFVVNAVLDIAFDSSPTGSFSGSG